jgi:hypothetical protein
MRRTTRHVRPPASPANNLIDAQAPTGAAPDPLAALLRQAVHQAEDADVRDWFRGLLEAGDCAPVPVPGGPGSVRKKPRGRKRPPPKG